MKLWGQNGHQESSVGTEAPGLAQMGRHQVWSRDASQREARLSWAVPPSHLCKHYVL